VASKWKFKVGLKQKDGSWKYFCYEDEDSLMEDLFDHVLVYQKISITRIQ